MKFKFWTFVSLQKLLNHAHDRAVHATEVAVQRMRPLQLAATLMLIAAAAADSEAATARDVELSPLRELLEHAADVLQGAAVHSDAFVPVFDLTLARAAHGQERRHYVEQLQRLFARNVPFILRGAGVPTAEWTADYLRTQLHDSTEPARIALHAFVGDTYQYGAPSNARTQFAGAHAASWWRMWDAGVCVQDAAAVQTDMAAAGWDSEAAAALEQAAIANASRSSCGFTPASLEHRRTYLQVTNGERAFVEDDTQPLFGSWLQPRCGSERGAGELCRDEFDDILVRDAAVIGHTPVECRFGYRGTRVEAHFDTYDNLVLLAAGRRMYVLSPPEECPKLSVSRTPSRLRHSTVDWASRRVWRSHPFRTATGVAVQLGAGDVLRIPPFWFHFIVSVTPTAQCSKMIAKSVYPRSIMQCLARNASDTVVQDDAAMMQVDAGVMPLTAALARLPLQRDGDDVVTLDSVSSARVMDAIELEDGRDWRDAPWMQPGLTPYSDAARDATDSALLQAWYSLQDAVTALGSDTAVPAYVVQEAVRWMPMLAPRDVQQACLLLQRQRQHAVQLQMQLAAPNAACDDVTDALSKVEVHVDCTRGDGASARVSMHFQGSVVFCASSMRRDGSARASARTGRILATLTDISAARETAAYEYTLRPSSQRHGQAADDEVEDDVVLRRVATVYTFPSLRGVLGIAMRIRGNIAGFAQEGLVSPVVYNILLMMLAGPLLLPCACGLLLCVRCLPKARPRAAEASDDAVDASDDAGQSSSSVTQADASNMDERASEPQLHDDGIRRRTRVL